MLIPNFLIELPYLILFICHFLRIFAANETVEKLCFRTLSYQNPRSTTKVLLCPQNSAIAQNAVGEGSDAVLSEFPFRSSTFVTVYCLSKRMSICGFPRASTFAITGVQKQGKAAFLRVDGVARAQFLPTCHVVADAPDDSW